MIQQGLIESDRRRIGAELEMFLVDEHWQPKACSLQVLERLDDPHFTTELALFNLEANLDPLESNPRCLRSMEEQLNTLVAKARSAAASVGARVVLTGILPSISPSDLSLDNLTPLERYKILNKALTDLRGDSYHFRILGTDELLLSHDSVMVESCNASFQCHFQLSAEEFPRFYNLAQVLAAPTLALAANSPLLFGKRLWAETRIALFEQAVDTRQARDDLRELPPRVWFGGDYLKESVLELYREDVSRFRALFGVEVEEDSLAVLDRGEIPKLSALSLYNGTVYRWNRACYGVTDGKPHLRIENRLLPSGPSTVDCVANAAFWFGLMAGYAEKYEDITTRLPFEEARTNFHTAARYGMGAELAWFDGSRRPVSKLVEEELLDVAREGLEHAQIDRSDIQRYLGVVEERMTLRQTGTTWLLDSLQGMPDKNSTSEKMSTLTAALCSRQVEGRPVAQWDLANINELGSAMTFQRVGQFMRTDLFTVDAEEPIELVANVMDWNRVRHVLVEDAQHRLVGLVSYRALLRVLGKAASTENSAARPISEIMRKDPICVETSTPTLDAIHLMRQHRLACLPVVRDGRLVGVVTERDFMDITADLLEERLRPGEAEAT